MEIISKIYLISVAGSCFFHLMMTVYMRAGLNEGYEEAKNMDRIYSDAPFSYKFILVILPLMNTFFSLLAIKLAYVNINFYTAKLWFKIGDKVLKKFNQNSFKYFKIKTLILKKLWPFHLRDYLLTCFIDKLFIKLLKDEKENLEC